MNHGTWCKEVLMGLAHYAGLRPRKADMADHFTGVFLTHPERLELTSSEGAGSSLRQRLCLECSAGARTKIPAGCYRASACRPRHSRILLVVLIPVENAGSMYTAGPR